MAEPDAVRHGLRSCGIGHALDEVLGWRSPHEQDAVRTSTSAALVEHPLAILAGLDRAGDEAVIGLGKDVLDAAQNFEKERLRKQGHQQVESMRAPAPESSRDRAWLVAQPLHGGHNALARRFGD